MTDPTLLSDAQAALEPKNITLEYAGTFNEPMYKLARCRRNYGDVIAAKYVSNVKGQTHVEVDGMRLISDSGVSFTRGLLAIFANAAVSLALDDVKKIIGEYVGASPDRNELLAKLIARIDAMKEQK